MVEYIAHSASDGHTEQGYSEHVRNVHDEAVRFAKELEQYNSHAQGSLVCNVHNAAILHDLGKLDEDNQSALHHAARGKHLPVNHTDAGTAALLRSNEIISAVDVYSHHIGLPDMVKEELRCEACLRDTDPDVRCRTDTSLDHLLRVHSSLYDVPLVLSGNYQGDISVYLRMTLSCLVDADHSDTAKHYGQYPEDTFIPELKPTERLAVLNAHMSALAHNDTRSLLRQEMYECCRDAEISGCFSACDSPVGSGKTTAVMAHLLKQAECRNSRRIFVILPYTSIITQSVRVYRKYLTLPGEDPEAVVAELHSKADFEDIDVRYLTALWKAPIIVTTAVAFFETLASCRPASLRKLHELPGSVLFIDEAHAALPIHLLPLAWHWINILGNDWGCYWVLASGSLVRYWNINRLIQPSDNVPDLVNYDLRQRLMQYEMNRVVYRWESKPLNRRSLLLRVKDTPGPRLLIVNTVQNAAVLADDLRCMYGRGRVEHLSTALMPSDRNSTISRIEKRLSDRTDTDWILVATSCVEAGVDFSFRSGFREASSLVSLLQAAGRINRHGTMTDSEMWTFTLQDDSMLNKNMGINTSAKVLQDYLKVEQALTPELCTRAMEDEIVRDDSILRSFTELLQAEQSCQFKEVAEKYEVIDSRTVIAVIGEELLQMIHQGKSNWRYLQLHSISVPTYKVAEWSLREISHDLYEWTLPYDDFLGYMAGVLPKLKRQR